MAYEKILSIVPTIQSASLVKHNLSFLKKKKKKKRDFIDEGVNNIVGTTLVKENAKFLYG